MFAVFFSAVVVLAAVVSAIIVLAAVAFAVALRVSRVKPSWLVRGVVPHSARVF